MRLELYGCDYIPDVLHFNGKSLIRRGLSKFPVNSLRDTFRFRFKTNKENGIILYSRGSQGDYISLQLAENRLLLNMKLGGNRETSIMLGSLLDDNIYHDVEISRLVVMRNASFGVNILTINSSNNLLSSIHTFLFMQG